MFSEGQQVRVIDDECPLHNQVVTIIGPNPRCTAEWVVWDREDKPWVIHSCRLRDVPNHERYVANEVYQLDQRLRDIRTALLKLGDESYDFGFQNTSDDLHYAVSAIDDALRAMEIRTSTPLG